MRRVFDLLLWLVLINSFLFAQGSGFYKEIMIFSNVLNHVKTNYVEETDPSELIGSAIYGLLTSLDPHTVYLDPRRFNRFTSLMSGESYGIGIAIEIIDGQPTVVTVIPGGPADEANLNTGDILLKVDGQSVLRLSEPELQLMLAGTKGSEVSLTVRKYLSEEKTEVILKRDEIPIHSINHSFLLDAHTGYVKIDNFSQTTGEELKAALKKLKKQGMRRLVLDLRGNPGGQLQSAVEVVDMFIDKEKVIMRTKGRKFDANKIYYSSDDDKQPRYPLIVMIDRGSASASEIVAGALQEHDRALIVGTNSFGKGLVQGTFLLNNGGAILMTIARYYTPIGRQIQREYEGRNFEAYYAQIFETDSSNYRERPTLQTLGGRTIYGGGGVVPDIFVEKQSPPFSNWNEIQEAKLVFKAANAYVKINKNNLLEFKDVREYAENFMLDRSTVEDFSN